MIEKAIEKLKSEDKLTGGIAKLRDLLVEALGKGDEQLANAVMDEKKSMETCFSHIKNWARSQAVAGCAMIDSDSVLGEAIHYFLDVKEEAKKAAAKKPSVQISKPVENKKPEPVKAPASAEKDKEMDGKSVAKPKAVTSNKNSKPKLEVEVFDLFG